MEPQEKALVIHGQQVDQVECLKYLGIDIDNQLSFGHQADSVFKNAQQHLHLLRKLSSFNVRKDILTLVYTSLIESILTYNISSWYNFLTVKHKAKLLRILNQASKITQTPQTPLSELYRRSVLRKAPLLHPAAIGQRIQNSTGHKNAYKKSFINPLNSVW